MTIKFEAVKAGDVLYDVRSERMGSTQMSLLCCREVHVVSIDHAAGTAVTQTLGNQPRSEERSQIKRYRRSPPKEKP